MLVCRGALQWDKDPPPAEWDHALAALSGHPLQSCLWGDARGTVDGIVQHRWLARCNGEPIWMIRVEDAKCRAARSPGHRGARLDARRT